MRGRGIVLLAGVVLLLVALAAAVFGLTRNYRPSRPVSGELVVWSTTDTAVFAPVIADFRRMYPGVRLRYELLDAEPLYHGFLRDTSAGRQRADLLLSTSMDLQAKLVNDGYAAPHVSANGRALPRWARWRDEAFGITFEPVVMVFNRRLMQGRELPTSRGALLADLRRDPEFWRGRIGTYDIARSGVGYLFAAQDARLNSDSGMLIDSFGDMDAFIDENSATVIDRVEEGSLAMGYNILGSYARARLDAGAPLTMVYPRDYTLTVSRTALIPKTAPHPEEAHLFLEYLLSLRGQSVLAEQSRLNAVRPEIRGPYSGLGVESSEVGVLKPIALGPGLLVYLDQRKQAAMIQSWQAAIDPASNGRDVP